MLRLRGVKCLGLYCLLSAKQAREHVIFFLSLIEKDTTDISLAAISVLFDFLTYFGPAAMGDTYSDEGDTLDIKERARIAKEKARERRRKNAKKRLDERKGEVSDIEEDKEEEELNTKRGEIIKTLVGKMNSMNEEIRSLCTKGFCKLFFTDVIEYPSILGTLIVELFHPLTVKFKNDQACLRAFFPAFSAIPKHQLTLEQALLLVVSLVLDTYEGSSLSKIKLADLLAFYFPLLLPNSNAPQDAKFDTNIHKRIAKKFLSMIASSPLGNATRELSPVLLKLTLQPNSSGVSTPKTPKKGEEVDRPGQVVENLEAKAGQEIIYECRVILEMALGFVSDKTAKANLEKFKQRLEAIDNSPLKSVYLFRSQLIC